MELESEGKKIVWVKWFKICKSKHPGVLDIKDLHLYEVLL